MSITKKDARALWWAIDWTSRVLREWRREGFKDAQDQAQYEAQMQKLLHAKYALRQVRAAIKANGQEQRKTAGEPKICRSDEKLQVMQEVQEQ